jgi:hypothetical protein
MEKQEFMSYLTETLIPDLRESGHHMTANDFQNAVSFLMGSREVCLDCSRDTQSCSCEYE